jgi:hypothetical protein
MCICVCTYVRTYVCMYSDCSRLRASWDCKVEYLSGHGYLFVFSLYGLVMV